MRIILIVLLSMLSISGYASGWTNFVDASNDLKYAKSIHDFDLIVKETLRYISCAETVKEYDVEAWNFNNLSNVYIEEFKDRADYNNRMDKIFKAKKGSNMREFIKESKDTFISEIELLQTAKQYLIKAQLLTNKHRDAERTKKILSNWKFIEYVYKFIKWESAKSVTDNVKVSVR